MDSITNNKAEITGVVVSEPAFSHEIYGEKFYLFLMDIPRLSGASDQIKVMLSARLMTEGVVVQGRRITVRGQFRSYNSYDDGSTKLVLTVFARELAELDEFEENPNTIFLNGYICKEPVYRTTPFGREITDMLVAVNRTYNKSDYIPVIAWGRNARFCKGLEIGTNVRIWGRIQSREYQKKLGEDEVVTKTAYEISVSRLEVGEE